MQTQNISENYKLAVQTAVKTLRSGGLIVYPSDTCYGIGCSIDDKAAIAKLDQFKGERGNKPYSVIVSDIDMLQKYVEVTKLGRRLIEKYMPGRITVVMPAKQDYFGVNKVNPTLGIRLPDAKFITDVVINFGHPVISTSANVSNDDPPYDIIKYRDNVYQKIAVKPDYIFGDGELDPNVKPSTVVSAIGDKVELLRQGGVIVEV